MRMVRTTLRGTSRPLGNRDADRVAEPSTFGDMLRRYRTNAKLTQAALAERSGISVQAIGALERGVRRRPYRVTIDMLADALGLAADERAELVFSARATGLASQPSQAR